MMSFLIHMVGGYLIMSYSAFFIVSLLPSPLPVADHAVVADMTVGDMLLLLHGTRQAAGTVPRVSVHASLIQLLSFWRQPDPPKWHPTNGNLIGTTRRWVQLFPIGPALQPAEAAWRWVLSYWYLGRKTIGVSLHHSNAIYGMVKSRWQGDRSPEKKH